jgi:hypothetical protein
VHEDVRSVGAGDEAVALLRVEPLDGSLCHVAPYRGWIRVRTVRYPGRFLDATFPRSLKRRARNIVLRERAGDTNIQDNYDQTAQPIRCPVHSRPPAVAKLRR